MADLTNAPAGAKEHEFMRRFLLGLAVTAISVVLLFWAIDWRTSIAALRGTDPWFVAGAVTCLVLSLVAKTVRWRFLLPPESTISTPRLYRILHISFLLNNVLPARLGDVARVAMTARQPGLRIGHVLSSLVTERFADTVTLLACFVLVSPFLPLPQHYVEWLHIAWYVLAGLAVAGIAFVVLRRHIEALASRVPTPGGFPGATRMRSEALSFRQGLGHLVSREHLVPIWATSIIAWLTAFSINWLIFKSLDIDVPITVAVLVTCITNMAMLVPSSPGYIGVFHAAATLVLVPFGVSASRALSFAIVAHLVNVVPVSIIGAIFLLAGRDAIGFSLRNKGQPTIDPSGAK
jgi:glycosyltransferase 2 family protein